MQIEETREKYEIGTANVSYNISLFAGNGQKKCLFVAVAYK